MSWCDGRQSRGVHERLTPHFSFFSHGCAGLPRVHRRSGWSRRRRCGRITLIDFEHIYDSTTLFIYSGHLLVFNPGERDAELTVTAYYEDREPDQFRLQAPAGASTESNPLGWPIRRGGYFALKIESDLPVICQATLGWANTGGDLSWGAPTKNGSKVRETAKSYMAIQTLARHWYVAMQSSSAMGSGTRPRNGSPMPRLTPCGSASRSGRSC